MSTRPIFGVMMLVSVAGLPAVAFAQVTPPTPPVPRVAPAPRVAPTPRVAPVLPEAALDRLRALRLDDLRLTLPEIAVTLPDLSLALGDLQSSMLTADQARAVRDAAYEAMQHARTMLDATHVADWAHLADWQDRGMTYTFATQKGAADYTTGKDLLNRRQYEQAIVRFDRVIAQKAEHVDGALYWKAYAQFKLARTDDCLATIAQLRRDHQQSRYNTDAKALETDARKMAGQPVNPDSLDNSELKILAINGIKDADPDRAIPLLEGVLNSSNDPVVKRQALFVLATINQPRAYQILLNFAKGAGNPDLQLEAIRYITANRNKQANATDLLQIYQSTQDTDVKLAIIGALRTTGNRLALTDIVSSGAAPMVVRTTALNGLAGILSPQDLWTLYEKETNKDLRLQMIGVFGSMQAVDQLNRAIKTEKDPEVRRRAVRTLGNLKSDKTGQMLVDMYATESDVETRKTIISALGSQNNAEGLVAIARKEASLPLKTEIVRRLSEMAPRNKVAADYLMEIIR